MCKGSFNSVSKEFQGSFNSVLRKLQEFFNKVSRVFQDFKIEGCIKGVLIGFQEYMKGNSREASNEFQGCTFQGYLKKFQRSWSGASSRIECNFGSNCILV